MVRATYQLLIDWNGDSTLGNGTLEDVSDSLLSVNWARRREPPAPILGDFISGRLQAVLNNESGTFSPLNAASPLSGSLLPGRLVQLKGTYDGTVYTLYTGYVSRLQPSPNMRGANTVTVECIGPLGKVNELKVWTNANNVLGKLVGTIINDILDEAGWGAGTGFRSIDDGTATPGTLWVSDMRVMEALEMVADHDPGFMLESKTGKIVFEGRNHRGTGDHGTSQGTFSDAAASTLGFQGIQQLDSMPYVYNEFPTKVTPTTVDTGTLTVIWVMGGIAAPYLGNGSGTVSLWIYYPNADSPGTGVGAYGWSVLVPISGTYGTVWSQPDATGVNLTSVTNARPNKLYTNKARYDFDWTPGTTGAMAAYLTQFQMTAIVYKTTNPINVTVIDDTSATLYGTRSYPKTPKFLSSTTSAKEWGTYCVGTLKNPMTILSVSVVGNDSDAHMKQVMLRDLSDRITVIGTGNAGLGVNADFFIEGESHKITGDRRHIVTWECSKA